MPSVSVDGPTAAAAGPADQNLVLRAASALAEDPLLLSASFHLTKRLPVAAGLGGGSSDAAAALRLLANINRIDPHDSRILAAARRTGSDVPVCLAARARMMRGAGEALGPLLQMPPTFAVLVNPGVPVATPLVFSRLGLSPGEAHPGNAHPLIADGLSFEALLEKLATARNDLQEAACGLAPVISDALHAVAATDGCRLSRMSGSGATCFGLFATCREAARAAAHLRSRQPGWWVKTTILR